MTAGPPPAGTDQLRGSLRRAIRIGLLSAVAVAFVVSVAAVLVSGVPGLLGALLGCCLSAAFLLVTAGVAASTAGRDPTVMAAAMLGSWLVKVVVVLGLITVIRNVEGVDGLWFGVGMVISLLVTLAVEYRVVTTARIPYVEPR